MGAQGSAVINFGSFPGSSHASVDVATAGVVVTSLVEAWVLTVATADHSADEHMVETLKVVGAYLSDGNIRIHGFNTNQIVPPSTAVSSKTLGPGDAVDTFPRPDAPMLYGQFSVGWVWN
jgi:hypothetical protein